MQTSEDIFRPESVLHGRSERRVACARLAYANTISEWDFNYFGFVVRCDAPNVYNFCGTSGNAVLYAKAAMAASAPPSEWPSYIG